MTACRQQQIEQLPLSLPPADGSMVGSAELFEPVNSLHCFDTVRGELICGIKAEIAVLWQDTSYDGRGIESPEVLAPAAASE